MNDTPALLNSWLIHLAAERKSDQTLKTYGDGVRAFLRWAAATGTEPVLDRGTVNRFIASLIAGGAEPATARSRQLAVRRFSAWCAEEGEIDTDQLLGLKPPRLDVKVVDALDDDEIRRLLKACEGRELRDRRDAAIVRLMAETGARAGEVVNLKVTDVDLVAGTAVIRRGKGARGRVVPFGRQSAQSLDRYLRVRRTHRLADSPALWLGERQRGFTYQALYSALRARAEAAGIEGFHPHRLRHTAATRWLAAGGSEGGLMAVCGWSRADMLHRYTRASSEQRAADEARGLNLGDF
ncbi:tyrosine-type recombinase/integrase [Streptomyces sp. NBC_00879]|uniref:tyrosine-type recombinase/integrase n=1 Tax=Streptomyces sp. NBC_00879 TaxID=2975855 RepID=UPI00386ECADF|nr:tyrosine-type recombinase/integrase [Streptomyces sp. NBC_00879]